MEDKILDIASLFDIDGTPTDFRPWGGGLINDTFLVTTDKDKKYILQRINTDIFRNPELLQHNLKLITEHIRRCLIRENPSLNENEISRLTLTAVDCRDSASFAQVGGEVWRMTRFIEGSHTEESVTPEMARLTGKAFADFHKYFAAPDAPALDETIPDFHNLEFRLRQLREAMAENRADRLQWVGDLCEYLLSRSDEMLLAERLNQEGKLPKRVAHCDTKLNNILFDDNNEVLCVIDLDTTMPGYVLSDFGDFIRTAGNRGAEDAEDLNTVEVDMDIFRAFAEGYLSEAGFLTETERELLPYGAQRLTYMQAVRFLTDYINGDTYYKTLYPEHNLVRTRAQIKLLQSIDAHMPEMMEIIHTYLHSPF